MPSQPGQDNKTIQEWAEREDERRKNAVEKAKVLQVNLAGQVEAQDRSIDDRCRSPTRVPRLISIGLFGLGIPLPLSYKVDACILGLETPVAPSRMEGDPLIPVNNSQNQRPDYWCLKNREKFDRRIQASGAPQLRRRRHTPRPPALSSPAPCSRTCAISTGSIFSHRHLFLLQTTIIMSEIPRTWTWRLRISNGVHRQRTKLKATQ